MINVKLAPTFSWTEVYQCDILKFTGLSSISCVFFLPFGQLFLVLRKGQIPPNRFRSNVITLLPSDPNLPAKIINNHDNQVIRWWEIVHFITKESHKTGEVNQSCLINTPFISSNVTRNRSWQECQPYPIQHPVNSPLPPPNLPLPTLYSQPYQGYGVSPSSC